MNRPDPGVVIEPATQADAPYIATAIMSAVGYECCDSLAGADYTTAHVHGLFEDLARRIDSQYSYLNTLVARTPDGRVAGVCIGYDGADLPRLSRAFFEKAKEVLGRDLTGGDPETTPDEFYLDTLAVWPEHRHRGIGGRLLLAQAARGKQLTGKHAGLLVDKENPKAEHLYRSLGFRSAGERPFLGTMMNHLVLD